MANRFIIVNNTSIEEMKGVFKKLQVIVYQTSHV